ncbi:MAG: hypothetical protein OER86_00100 [Phycisphaerae bacterium]|nr:hypothetical protein [Phycisphaerae bacterium]
MTENPDSNDTQDDLHALAEAAVESSSETVATRHLCPSCGSAEFKSGLCTAQPAGRHVFVPNGAGLSLNMGYSVKAAVCLECGHLRHHLTAEDLAKLRSK